MGSGHEKPGCSLRSLDAGQHRRSPASWQVVEVFASIGLLIQSGTATQPPTAAAVAVALGCPDCLWSGNRRPLHGMIFSAGCLLRKASATGFRVAELKTTATASPVAS